MLPKMERLFMAICSESNPVNEDGCWGGGGGVTRGLMSGLSHAPIMQFRLSLPH